LEKNDQARESLSKKRTVKPKRYAAIATLPRIESKRIGGRSRPKQRRHEETSDLQARVCSLANVPARFTKEVNLAIDRATSILNDGLATLRPDHVAMVI